LLVVDQAGVSCRSCFAGLVGANVGQDVQDLEDLTASTSAYVPLLWRADGRPGTSCPVWHGGGT
jgi:hypothetical protein